MYIYERETWPNFTWDAEVLSPLLIRLRHQQGRLLGGMEAIGFHSRDETVLQTLTQDVLKSSEIDGFEGKLTSSKWAKIAKCSQDTAYRDILDLIHRGILSKNEDGGRNTSYSLIIDY